jgi:Histidine kinase-, DNA gyrase B-, and HSP90-like ATPase
VTPYDEATSKAIAKRKAAAERKRLERDRRKAAPIIHETADWRLFLDPETLPQKAGCQPDDIGALVLKELVDNALDAGASVTVQHAPEQQRWIVTDTGPGIDPDDVPRLFCVNRPLLSSKLKRMPTRGMLGNGLRVVMAWARTAFVISRGVAQRLEINPATGLTVVTYRTGVPMSSGLTVEVRAEDPDDACYAKLTIALAKLGFDYKGPSSPHWYGYSDFARLFSDAPSSASAADVVADLGLVPPKTLTGRPARTLGLDDTTALLRELRQQTPPVQPDKIGRLGPEVYQDSPGYKRKSGIRREPAGGHVPYVLEAHVGCKRADKRSNSNLAFSLTINKSRSLVQMLGGFNGDEFRLQGCGMKLSIKVPSGIYSIALSIITPNLQNIGRQGTSA